MMEYVTRANLDERTDEWLKAIAPVNVRDWLPEPGRSALLVIDCQNYFVSYPEPHGAPILDRINGLLSAFHSSGRPVIFTRHMHKSDLSDTGMLGEWWGENIIEGTSESELHRSLDVKPSDIVIGKNRYNAFYGTDLINILAEKQVRDIVITGVMTNLCCETTARDAFVRDFRVFFPADASGTVSEEMHFASLLNIAYGFGVVLKAKQILDVLSL
jgi:isochorismate hydrolase